MVARAKKQLQEESEAAADMFAVPTTMSDEEGEMRRARKAKGRCKDRERSLRKKLNSQGSETVAGRKVDAEDMEPEAPSKPQEEQRVLPLKGGCAGSGERERSSVRQRKQTGEDKKSRKSQQQPSDPSGVWDSTDSPVDFIASMKAEGQRLLDARQQEVDEDEIAKAEEAKRRETARKRREIQAREDELRELHEIEALKAEAEKAVAAVKAVSPVRAAKPDRPRASSGELTKTVAFADLVHAEPVKDAAESPFDDLYGWVVV